MFRKVIYTMDSFPHLQRVLDLGNRALMSIHEIFHQYNIAKRKQKYKPSLDQFIEMRNVCILMEKEILENYREKVLEKGWSYTIGKSLNKH